MKRGRQGADRSDRSGELDRRKAPAVTQGGCEQGAFGPTLRTSERGGERDHAKICDAGDPPESARQDALARMCWPGLGRPRAGVGSARVARYVASSHAIAGGTYAKAQRDGEASPRRRSKPRDDVVGDVGLVIMARSPFNVVALASSLVWSLVWSLVSYPRRTRVGHRR